jgi:hypothetical protein
MNQSIIKEIEIIECPICMDEIGGEKNKITTECGHCFHANCLMKNVAHNGFGCPYCRTAMAEVIADDDDIDDDDEYEEDYLVEGEGNDFSDNVLRGSRWLFQRAEGDELDDEEDSVFEEEEPELVDNRPSVEYIVEKLVQRGVTMSDLVKSLLLNDHEEFQYEESFERGDSELFGKLRTIISNFQPEDASVAVSVSNTPVETCQHVPDCDGEISNEISTSSNTYQSTRLRRHNALIKSTNNCENNNSDDEESVWVSDDETEDVVTLDKAIELYHQGPIRKGVTVNINDSSSYYTLERLSRYEKITNLYQLPGRVLNFEEQPTTSKLQFNFQMRGSCRSQNEVA